MRNLDLSNYGVNEMNTIEQEENNGGFIVVTIGAIAIGGGLVELFLAGAAIGAGIGVAAAMD